MVAICALYRYRDDFSIKILVLTTKSPLGGELCLEQPNEFFCRIIEGSASGTPSNCGNRMCGVAVIRPGLSSSHPRYEAFIITLGSES